MKHGHSLRFRTSWYSCVGAVVGARVRIEEIVIIVTLLDHPNDDEDDDVQEMFLDEQTAHWCTNTRSVQSSVAVDSRVDGDDDVEGEGHGEHQVRLRLNLRELVIWRGIDAIIRCFIVCVHVGVHAEDDHDEKE